MKRRTFMKYLGMLPFVPVVEDVLAKTDVVVEPLPMEPLDPAMIQAIEEARAMMDAQPVPFYGRSIADHPDVRAAQEIQNIWSRKLLNKFYDNTVLSKV